MVSSLPNDKHPDTTPRRPVLRKLLRTLTRTDADFDAFCMDYFSQVHARFSQGMDRLSKVNLLLELTEPTDVLKRLREQYRNDHSALEVINHHLCERETEAAQRAWALREELERLYLEREQRRLFNRNTDHLDAAIVAVKRRQRQAPKLQEGEILGDRYRLLEVIGKGGFARVWQAYDREACRLVAVKILHRESGDDARRLERFLRGAREMKELEHPNIVRVLDDPAEYNGFHYFVMHYLSGGDLFRAISTGVIGQAEALKTILSVGFALEYAHRSHLIHRDVKPHNILLDGCGGARLTDFDLVWAADTTGGTRTGFLGTHIYVAPEQAENAKSVDSRADIYSLGMTTLFVLYGKALPQRAVYQRALFIDELPCDEQVKGLLRQATAIDPDDRPASISTFCRELSHALDGNPPGPPAPKDSTITQLTKSNAVSAAKPLPSSRPSKPPSEPTAQSASTHLPQQKKNRKLQMFIILAVLAVLAPLVALFLKGLLSHSMDYGDSQVVPEIDRSLNSNPPTPGHTVATAPTPMATSPPASEADDPQKVVANQPDEPTDDGVDDKPTTKTSQSSESRKSVARPNGSRSTVRILVDSTPRKATVERDGTKIGVTPIVDSPLQGNRAVRYRFLAKGYISYEESVLPDRKRTISVKLRPEPQTFFAGSDGQPKRAEKRELPEQLSREQISSGFRSANANSNSCTSQGASGIYNVKVTIGRDGRVIEANIVSGGDGKDCVAKAVKNARFLEFSGYPMSLTYPLIVR